MGWEIMNHSRYRPDFNPSDFNFFGPIAVHLNRNSKLTMNSNVVSWTNYIVRINLFTLLALVTSHNSGKNVLVYKAQISWKGVKVWWVWYVYSLCKTKTTTTTNNVQANLEPPSQTYWSCIIYRNLSSAHLGYAASFRLKLLIRFHCTGVHGHLPYGSFGKEINLPNFHKVSHIPRWILTTLHILTLKYRYYTLKLT